MEGCGFLKQFKFTTKLTKAYTRTKETDLSFFIDVYLIYSIVLVSGIQQSDSVYIYLHIYIYSYTDTYIYIHMGLSSTVKNPPAI